MESEHQVPIWFFIGTLLLVYGIIITISALHTLAFPPPVSERVVLFELHADLWWGVLLVALGAFYSIRFRPGKNR